MANPVAAQDAVTVEDALAALDGTEIVADGTIGVLVSDLLAFRLEDRRQFRVEMAVDRPTLERVEACYLNDYNGPVCPVRITGALRVKDDYFQVLVDSVTFIE
ncbi:hypothetical protein [Jannaschia formosa]|uniref:hypothetical protein n=1 Tax=Jannaschia formosa TaxID=2259592 RepID=UPI0010757DCE|nr:hypothetical protein [Jannaschia formosa]TFL16440.1 hypothetical protein DR046_20175 [Jannaschia formosa]